ncbi:hypothetical protein [Chryseobacterium sp. SIMBA_038]|uniref:hypothetical protein n=3 Tax=Bacteria TaxID=2 RepID=UPI003979D1B6
MKIQEYLNLWNDELINLNYNISEFLIKSVLLSKQYEEKKSRKLDLGYNIFTTISNYYYRENFHSDILKSILENTKSDTFNLFIKFLNSSKFGLNINSDDFSNAVFYREKERIDILILDDFSKKAIIIENKINNASDTERQLPKYFDRISIDYDVVAIVYLTLDSSKTPDRFDWTEDEIEKLEDKIVLIPSMIDKIPNLVEDFLNPATLLVRDLDINSTIRQYSKLIQYLNYNSMDSISLEKFYKTILEQDNLNTAISIQNMLNDLPAYLALRIEDKYLQKCFPFIKLWRYSNSIAVFEGFEIEKLYFKLDINCSINGYRAVFWNPVITDFDTKEKFRNFKSLEDFYVENGVVSHIVKYYDLNNEKSLFEFIDHLLSELKALKLNYQPLSN